MQDLLSLFSKNILVLLLFVLLIVFFIFILGSSIEDKFNILALGFKRLMIILKNIELLYALYKTVQWVTVHIK